MKIFPNCDQMVSFHSWINRGYAIFYMTVAAVCFNAAVGALIAYCSSISAPVDFSISNISYFNSFKSSTYEQAEEAHLQMNISLDLRPLFSVNVRHFYASIVAQWNTSDTGVHSSIVWNHIIKPKYALIEKQNEFGHFPLRQIGPATLKGKTVDFYFKIQQVPHVGFFKSKVLGKTQITFPNHYIAPLTIPTPVPQPVNDVNEI